MKIAFLLNDFPVWSETFILNQITGLIDRGHSVDIYARSRRDEAVLQQPVIAYRLGENVSYRRSPHRPFRRISKSARVLLQLLRRKFPPLDPLLMGALNYLYWTKNPATTNYDVIHSHFGSSGIWALELRREGFLSGPILTSFHGADLSVELERLNYRSLFQQGDLFLPVSEHWMQTLIRMQCPTEKILVHRMGVNCQPFSPPVEKASSAVMHIVSVGRLVEKKGFEFALKSFAHYASSNHDARYTIIGDGPLRGRLEALAAQLGISGSVHFRGALPQSSIIEVLQASDIFLAPSVTATDGDKEGIPVSIMEAMAVALPVVSTTHSGIGELVTDGVTGLLTPERDVEALTRHLQYLTDYPDKRIEFGRNARAFVVQMHNIETLNERLVEIYRHVASPGHLRSINSCGKLPDYERSPA